MLAEFIWMSFFRKPSIIPLAGLEITDCFQPTIATTAKQFTEVNLPSSLSVITEPAHEPSSLYSLLH